MRKKAESGRRTRGSGGVYELPDGRYRWQLRAIVQGKRLVVSSGTEDGEPAANRKLSAARTDWERGLLSVKDALTFEAFASGWLKRQRDLRPRTRTLYAGEIAYASKFIGDVKVQGIRKSHIEAMVTGLAAQVSTSMGNAGEPLATRTVRVVLTRVRAVLDDAVAEGLVYVNHARKVKSPKARGTSKGGEQAGQVLDLPELARFLELGSLLIEIGSCRLWPAILTVASIGLRRSEVMGLTWADVDFDANTVCVRRGLVSDDGEVSISEGGKTQNATRDIPLPQRLRVALLEHRELLEVELLENGLSLTLDTPVFATASGVYTHPENLNRSMSGLIEWSDPDPQPKKKDKGKELPKRVAKLTLLERRMLAVERQKRPRLLEVITSGKRLPEISPHDLRHTYATTALRQGVPVEVVSKVLGHAKVSITLDIYRHVLSSEKQDYIVDMFSGTTVTQKKPTSSVLN